MKKHLTIMTVILLAFATIFSGCAKNASGNDTVKEITWARSYESTSIDPTEAADDNSVNIVSYTTEPLLRLLNGELVEGIAKSWEVADDNVTYTIKLRKSKWSDGSALTANDFVYSFFRLINPEQGHGQANAGYVVLNAQEYAEGTADISEVGYKALDDYTLEIVFKATSFENIYSLASSAFSPVKESIAADAETAYGSDMDAFLGNGPFVITEWSHENQIVLEKNPEYWNADTIKITKLTGLANVADDTAMEMMQTGAVDLAQFSKPVYYETLAGEGFEVEAYSNSYQFLHINHAGKTEDSGRFLSNTNFRLALSYALDRAALCASVLEGQTPATRLADSGMMGSDDYFVSEYPYENAINATADAAKAKEYLALALEELGATIEDVPELSMLCYESPNSQTALQAAQDMFLTTLGINCVIDPQPIQQMIGKVYSFDYDFWWGGLSVGTVDMGSTDGVLSYFSSANPDALFGYDNAEYNEYFATATSTLDTKARFDAIAELEKIFCEEVPDLLITWSTAHCVYKPEIILEGGISSSYGADLAFADIAVD